MKQKIIPLYFITILFCGFAFSQTPNRTPEKIKQDSIEFEQFKKRNSELFLNKRLPVNLLDGNSFIPGYSSLGIRITNNHLVDSINYNYHHGSKGAGIIPYSNIQVTDEKLSLDLLSQTVFTQTTKADSALITQFDASSIQHGMIDNKPITPKGQFVALGMENNKYPFDSITINHFKGDSIEIRISINGKLLFDWTPLNRFTKNTFKYEQRWPAPNEKMRPFWLIAYGEGYHIADQLLKINDQLLIEIKDDKNGWMLDRFNFTRVAATPAITTITPTDDKNKILSKEKAVVAVVEKKTSFLMQVPKN